MTFSHLADTYKVQSKQTDIFFDNINLIKLQWNI